ncbi:MAG: proline--tRNA ligase [Candidatus Aenigmarchaeota archaeon]|nr:proline--tRNA ligase [Candidatus Aenigmarchaeota archaeon]
MGRKKAAEKGERDNLGVTVTRKEDFSKWYTEIVRKGGFKDQRTPIKGFDVIQPWGYALWERIQGAYDALLKEHGIQNCYFPMLIPESFIEKEREHFKGFEAETANVTEVGSEPLSEKLVIRPTSETIAYHMFTKWIRSHRDLPFKINQWCNIVRWDTKVTKPFIRDREFLWSEVHTAHASLEDGLRQIDDYAEINDRFHEQLAMAAMVLRRTEKDKFPGAEFSVAYDTLVQDGKVFQGPGGHFLGQNFSKPFGIKFTHDDGRKEYVWQTCLGMTTRQIGGLIMQHGDDKGAILPPAIAPVQAVIVPIIFKGKEKKVIDQAKKLKEKLCSLGVRALLDEREYSAGYKFNDWELKGVPLRLELGPKDLEKNEVTLVKRNDGKKSSLKLSGLAKIRGVLDSIQKEMLEKSRRNLEANTRDARGMKELKKSVEKGGFSRANWCGSGECEDTIKDQTGAGIRGSIYGKSEQTFGDCVCCGKKAESVVYIAKAY